MCNKPGICKTEKMVQGEVIMKIINNTLHALCIISSFVMFCLSAKYKFPIYICYLVLVVVFSSYGAGRFGKIIEDIEWNEND